MTTYNITSMSPVATGALGTAPTYIAISGDLKGLSYHVKAKLTASGYSAVTDVRNDPVVLDSVHAAYAVSLPVNIDLQIVPVGPADTVPAAVVEIA